MVRNNIEWNWTFVKAEFHFKAEKNHVCNSKNLDAIFAIFTG